MQAQQQTAERSVTRAVNVTSRVAMSMDDLKKRVPSVFATKASQKMGDRYTFISTATVVGALSKMGLVPVEASQRKSQEATTARHLVRFARVADVGLAKARKVGEVTPEVVVANSHNGRSRLKIYFGMFRLACANGLIVADKTYAGLARRHTGDLAGIIEEVEEVLSHTKDVMLNVTSMQKTILSNAQRTAFANDALKLRYANPETGKLIGAPVTSADLLVPRRDLDEGVDLWHTFNVVQENLMRGGLEGKSANGRLVRTREVQDVRKVLTFNTELWSLAAARIAH